MVEGNHRGEAVSSCHLMGFEGMGPHQSKASSVSRDVPEMCLCLESIGSLPVFPSLHKLCLRNYILSFALEALYSSTG